MPINVLLPTPLPPKIPTRCPLPQVSSASTARIPQQIGSRLLVDVKGRRYPGGKEGRWRRVWESWSDREDIDGLTRWAELFGPDYQPPDYVVAAYQHARGHRWYGTARGITLFDDYSFDKTAPWAFATTQRHSAPPPAFPSSDAAAAGSTMQADVASCTGRPSFSHWKRSPSPRASMERAALSPTATMTSAGCEVITGAGLPELAVYEIRQSVPVRGWNLSSFTQTFRFKQ